MKYLYPKQFSSFIILLFLVFSGSLSVNGQCPYGYTPGTTFYDTTIATPAGINTLEVKFPQANPYDGMVTCLRLCVSITGVVDYASVENNSASPQTADIYYIRTDQITGPGLSGPISNSINYHYGPYALGSTDGNLGSGPDFISISSDTLLNAVTVCQTINDLDSLYQFYGNDSVTYQYNITAFTNISCTGGNYNSSVATSALVRFEFEYCTCPGYVLPLNVNDFTVTKIADDKAKLQWSGFDDPENPYPYQYEVQMSRNGRQFSGIAQVASESVPNGEYEHIYAVGANGPGTYYFRIKQVYSNGYTRFSDIKQVQLKSSPKPEFKIFPNPSNGIVGIKFDNYQGSELTLEVYNSAGQKILQKQVQTSGSSYHQVATLQSGNYWLKLTDMTTQLSSVNQLFIK